MEIILNTIVKPEIKAALFDFDGTLSSIRHGWEGIMTSMMAEMIAGPDEITPDLIREVREFIDKSAGLQTIRQMQWLADAVKSNGKSQNAVYDPFWYKEEYNRRLMVMVDMRRKEISTGMATSDKYSVKGSLDILRALSDKGVEIYLASGTDHDDVVAEAEILGFKKYFADIAGTRPDRVENPKEAALKKLTGKIGLKGSEIAVIGDGSVEIILGREAGALTLGVASEGEEMNGLNALKRSRLIKAGAHAIVGDYLELDKIMAWMGF